jgi:pimeloyl-ACP methyl ester carboxylesterase
MVHGVQRSRDGVAYLDQGEGAPVVLLHGFPDTPHTFDDLAAVLVAAGHRVIRPWLRGYPPTGLPTARTVPLPTLVGDLLGLVRALDLPSRGLDRPALVGHDWGAVIGWAATSRADHPFRAFAALAIPPPAVQVRALRDPVQLFHRSGYMWWMLVPGVERVMPAIAERLTRRWSPGWDPPDTHLQQVREVTGDRAAARAMAGYYRWIVPTTLRRWRQVPPPYRPGIPVRYLHGIRDTCFPAASARAARAHLPTGSVVVLRDCGHFLHLERPDAVAREVLDLLGATPGQGQR